MIQDIFHDFCDEAMLHAGVGMLDSIELSSLIKIVEIYKSLTILIWYMWNYDLAVDFHHGG